MARGYYKPTLMVSYGPIVLDKATFIRPLRKTQKNWRENFSLLGRPRKKGSQTHEFGAFLITPKQGNCGRPLGGVPSGKLT